MITRQCARVIHNSWRAHRHYSTSLSHFRTQETNPALLDESHAGRLYTMKPEDYVKLFGAKDKGVGLPHEFKIQCATFREVCLLVRTPFLDIKRCIEAYDLALPVLRFVLYGAPGNGKSLTVGSLVQYGYVKGYILVHVPWAPTWSRFAKETVPSSTRENYVDHTVDSVVWLTIFRNQNSKLLTDLKTTKAYDWSSRESTPEGSNIVEIIEHGISRPVHATECMYALLAELKTLSTQKKCKTMVAIDGINTFFYDAVRIRRKDKSVVPYKYVTAYDAFKQMLDADWAGGVVITTVDKLAIASEFRESDKPRYLLNKDGWERMDPFIPIHVDKYSSQECQTTLDYYMDRKWLAHPLAGTEEARKELETISVRNPYTLMTLCNSR